ncbi:Bap-like [Trichomonas vaginalis G3]|uniref:Bap-like n=1 Tax=Trichomonas vaginalis (strain ATCC PRA-98 / G3) TaxID=412133 RepID=A2DGB0_TRIV3|nr:hypothetical protein TVAGG3_0967060 [Trichomonas vaginalis G3]EAY20506.1 Bap-like [Trichomonas vaginalis G3]KAI5488318.1 hypothetical protein TVAGG3_0967060 [Trichomonas vaginalis G3]|eukprot:XP_001581492.1 Bap-like [Trichomonas vaginalis G3]
MAMLPLEIDSLSAEPYFYTPGTNLSIVANVYDYNANPVPYWYLTILKNEEPIEIGGETIEDISLESTSIGKNDRKTLKYPEEKDIPTSSIEVGNYTAELTFRESDEYDSKKFTKGRFDFFIRNRMHIEYIEGNKEFYFPGEEASLKFKFLNDEDEDTYYNVYVNDVKEVVHETNRDPFIVKIQIPENAPIGDYIINYNVSVADVIWSENKSGTIQVRAKPNISNPIRMDSYLIDDEIIILFTCNDEDDNDDFRISYKIGKTSDFHQLPDTISANVSKETILKIKVDNSLLKPGINEVFIKVSDSFHIESNIIQTDIKIVNKPVIIISRQSDFYQVGDDIHLYIDLTDNDDEDYANISFSFGEDSSNPTFLQQITYPNNGHSFSDYLETFKIPNARAGPLNLTIFATDSFGRTSNQTIVLLIHKNPTITPHILETDLVPGKTYQVTFDISDEDLPNDEINISYKLGSNDYQYVLTYRVDVAKEFNVSIPFDYPPGETTIFVKAVDNYSLSDEKRLTVNIKHKPTITVDELEKFDYTGGNVVIFKGIYSDEDNDLGKIHLISEIGNSTSEAINSGEIFSISLPIPKEQQVGSITVYLFGEDLDGLTSEKHPVTFRVRSTPPIWRM